MSLYWLKNDNEDPKSEFGAYVKISKYKNIFGKGYTPSSSEEVFVIIKVKNTVPLTCVISDLDGEEFVGTFHEKNRKKQIKKNLEQKK